MEMGRVRLQVSLRVNGSICFKLMMRTKLRTGDWWLRYKEELDQLVDTLSI